MIQYSMLLEKVMGQGIIRKNRTGINTLALFGEVLRFDLSDSFPIVTGKKVNFNNVTAELTGFLRGLSHVEDFNELGTNIWDANAEAWNHNGDLGRIYGVQWRSWRTSSGVLDQLHEAIKLIRTDPTSRRIIVTAWRPDELNQMCLPPCHIQFQFLVNCKKLTCVFYMRSVDVFLGLPYDICLYALLTHIVAQQCGLVPDKLIAMLADTHLYTNHLLQAEKYLSLPQYQLPFLELNESTTVDTFLPSHARLVDYKHGPYIQAEMAV